MEKNNIIVEKYIDNNGVVWTPLYDKDGITLFKTAEQCYLDNEQAKLNPTQSKPQEPSEQDKINANLMLEIAKLKAKVGTV